MKRYCLFYMILIMCCSATNAQTEFKNLIDSINWNLTENEIISEYSNKIQKSNHLYSDYDKTTTDYSFIDIQLGEYPCKASIFVDSISRKIQSLYFNFGDLTKQIDALSLSKKMDAILYPLFGEPDKVENDLDNKYVKDLDRSWYLDKYIVEVSHMIFSDSHVYSLKVEGIPDRGNDFRVAKWGDTKESIMQKEKKTNKLDFEEIYIFDDYVANMPCEVAYIFTDNKLSMAKYLFKSKHTNKNDYITDYKDLVNLMTEKYGKPKWDSPQWNNSLYKNDSDDYGFAISLGHLSYSAGWFGNLTDITVALYGENYEISLIIQYVSKKFEHKRKESSIKNRTKDL